MSLASRRKHEAKSWAKVYEDHISSLFVTPEERHELYTQEQIRKAKLIIARKFGRIVRARLKERSFSCRRTVQQCMQPPKPCEQWLPEWGSQLMCCLCNTPAVYGATYCQQCNAVAHSLCVQKMQDPRYFLCVPCSESFQEELDYQDKCLQTIRARNSKQLAEKIIESQLDTYRKRQMYLKLRNSAVLIQSVVRKHRAKTVFYMWRRTQLRVAIVEFLSLFQPLSGNQWPPELVQYGLVVLTVVDPIKHMQLFRLEKKLARCIKEGISALMQVVITVYLKDTRSNIASIRVPVIVGQTVIALRDTGRFLVPRVFDNLAVSKKITWIPSEVTMIGEHVPVALNTMRNLPQTTTPRPSSASSSIENRENEDLLPPVAFKGARAGDSIVPNMTSLSEMQWEHLVQHKCSIRYSPLNPISSVCMSVNGPPIDVLRKPPTHSSRRTNTAVEFSVPASGPKKRSTAYWICLVELWLFFFSNHGDGVARFISDLKEASIRQDKNPHHSNVLHIHHADSRRWSLEFEDSGKAAKFCFAVQESQRALSTGQSIYMPVPRTHAPRDFGYTCAAR